MTSRAASRSRRSGDRALLPLVLLVALPVLLVLVADPLQRLLGLPELLPVAVVGVVEGLTPAAAALAAARRARHERGTDAAGWRVLATACGLWAAGQVVWVGYEVVLRVPVPSASWADLGFFGFSLVAPAGVLLLAWRSLGASSRWRAVLDGLNVGWALLLLSWTLVLRPLVSTSATEHGGLFPLVLNLAYPVGGVLMVSLSLTVLARARTSASLVLITVGAALLSSADWGFAYENAVGTFSTGGLLDVLWTAGFAVLASAAALRGDGAPARPRPRRTTAVLQALPYVPPTAVSAIVVVRASREPLEVTTLVTFLVLIGLVLLRQALVVADNTRLTAQLEQRSSTLAELAYTDPLTGVANRTAFTAAIDAATAERRPVVLAFCDLDSFKAVNDVCGHAVGDALLVAVAARLTEVVRDGDVVARLGGDEFAVLARDTTSARPGQRSAACQALDARLATALSVPFSLEAGLADAVRDPAAQRVVDAVSASVGAVSSSELGEPTSRDLMHAADQRMYAVKRERGALR